jgi:cytoskeletal protein CcmA (bactofilin family)
VKIIHHKKMAMSKTPVQQESVSPNQINAGTEIVGNIRCNGNIRIDGNITGNIDCSGKVVIGKSSIIKGDVTGTNVDILGSVEGQVVASEKTSIRTGGKLLGNLQTGSLAIEAGCEFNGNCNMTTSQQGS